MFFPCRQFLFSIPASLRRPFDHRSRPMLRPSRGKALHLGGQERAQEQMDCRDEPNGLFSKPPGYPAPGAHSFFGAGGGSLVPPVGSLFQGRFFGKWCPICSLPCLNSRRVGERSENQRPGWTLLGPPPKKARSFWAVGQGPPRG